MRWLKTSLRNKLIALMAVCIVVPFAISILITHYFTKKMIDDRVIEENIRLFSEGKKNIASYLESIDNASLFAYSSPKMNEILTSGMATDDDKSFIFAALQQISRTVKDKDISQVFLYLNGSQKSYLFAQDLYYYGEGAILPPADQAVPPYSALLIPTHLSTHYGIRLIAASTQSVFTLYRPLYNVPSNNSTGFLSVDVKMDALRKLSSELYEEGRDEFYILDRSGIVMFASDDSLIGKPLQELWAEQLKPRQEDSGSLEWSDSRFRGMIIYSKLSNPSLDWIIAKRIPDRYLYAPTSELTLINAAVSVLFLTIAAVAMLYVSIRLTRPIKELIRSINKIHAGQLEEPISLERADEIGTLAKRFRAMMNTINDLINNGYKLELANKATQLKMLQAQINPHFMNNALQSIGASAIDSNAPEVYSLISSLGQMMHYSMRTEEIVVPVSKEIDYVKHYLALQRQRFDGKLKIEMDLDERTSAIPIPKMIVQPLVENFFKHGFRPEQGEAVLRIRASLEGDRLLLEVADNGKGVPEDRLAALQAALAKARFPLSGEEDKIGLINVSFRLRLYYEGQAEMTLEAVKPQGLKVSLRIPQTLQGGTYP